MILALLPKLNAQTACKEQCNQIYKVHKITIDMNTKHGVYTVMTNSNKGDGEMTSLERMKTVF